MAIKDVQIDPTPAIIRAVCERLRNRAELEGVHISRHETDVDSHPDNLILLNGTNDKPPAFLGNMALWHTVTIKGFIFVVRSGNTEEVSDEVMDRAYAIEHEMQREFMGSDEGHVLLQANGQRLVSDIGVARTEWDSGPWNNGTSRGFRIDFDLVAKAKTNRL